MLKYVSYDVVFQEIPDEVTLAINISNCPNGCPGCHSAYLQTDTGSILDENVLSGLLDRYGTTISCVCFMGGDSDPLRIEQLASFLCIHFPEIKTGWYSGKNDLPPGFSCKNFQYIKLGAYIESLGSLKSRTTNQRLYKVMPGGQPEDITSRFWR